MFNKIKFIVVSIICLGLTSAIAFAAQYTKELTNTFTATPTFATALNGSVGAPSTMFCSVSPTACKFVSVEIHLNSPLQNNLTLQMLVNGSTLPLTPHADNGGLKFTGVGSFNAVNNAYTVKLNLRSNTGVNVTLNPANGDYLSLYAATGGN